MVGNDWDIVARGPGCRLCANPFREGQDVVSAVFPKADLFVRRDYCASCYGRHAFRPFSYWRAPALAPKTPRRVTTDRVFGFFEKVASSDVAEHRRIAYLLSLWLLRKRSLVLREIEDASSGGRETFRLEDGEGRVFRVENPGIDLAEIEALEKELQSLLALTVESELSAGTLP